MADPTEKEAAVRQVAHELIEKQRALLLAACQAGYRICEHGLRVDHEWTDDVVTMRFVDRSHLLAPGETCAGREVDHG